MVLSGTPSARARMKGIEWSTYSLRSRVHSAFVNVVGSNVSTGSPGREACRGESSTG
jgi:hypothetical protein